MKRLGILGGTGIYRLKGFRKKDRVKLKSPFGRPSSDYIIFESKGKEIVFLPRHDIGHRISPSAINYRANIYGMKKLGVTKILSVSACGSLKENIKPLDFVAPNQFIDRASKRKSTFFEEGIVAHVALADPVCNSLAEIVQKSADALKINCHKGGIYVNIEGPQFSTKAESNLYRSWGADIIGMTNLSEAKLAREAEICYLTLAAVTDFDCWHSGFGSVSTEIIIENFKKNVEKSKQMIEEFVSQVDPETECSCHQALKDAIVTKRENIPQETKKKIKILIEKYIK